MKGEAARLSAASTLREARQQRGAWSGAPTN